MQQSNINNQNIPYKTVFNSQSQSWTGYIAIGALLFFWILSCTSPLIVGFLIYQQYYIPAIIYTLLFSIGYLPLPIIQSFRKQYEYHCSKYYSKNSLSYEEGSHALDKTKKTMMPIHPHGIFCLSWNTLYSRKELQHMKFCFSSMLLQGFFRLVSKITGNPSGVDKQTLTKIMKNGQSLALIPGGFEEASLFKYNQELLYLKNRAGFIKMALQYGYSLTPAYGFKECDSYYNYQGLKKIKLLLNKYSLPGVIVFGNKFFPVLPRRQTEIHVVVGKSLQLPQISNPTKEDVQKYHNQYIQEVQDLFNRHKFRFYKEEENPSLKLV